MCAVLCAIGSVTVQGVWVGDSPLCFLVPTGSHARDSPVRGTNSVNVAARARGEREYLCWWGGLEREGHREETEGVDQVPQSGMKFNNISHLVLLSYCRPNLGA